MKPDEAKLKINLLSNQKEIIGTTILKWVINTGKIVVIITEFIALAALSYRFIIDKQLNDLYSNIERKNQLIQTQAQQEQQYITLQNKIQVIKTIMTSTDQMVADFQDVIIKAKANDITIQSTGIKGNVVTINANAPSVYILNQTVDSIKQLKDVTSIDLDNVTVGPAGTDFILSVSLNLKQTDSSTKTVNANNTVSL